MRWLSALCLLLLCSCPGRQAAHRSVGTSGLTPEAAKQAIIRYIETHPGAFVSPGRAENVKDIQNVEVSSRATASITIGRFQVDLDKQSYTLMHEYGKPGSGWFEWWSWRGEFKMNKDGVWELTEPELEKLWGE